MELKPGNLHAIASTSLQEQIQLAETLPPSKIQTYLSELFRIALCRNDDYNLAGSSALRSTKQFQQAKPIGTTGSNVLMS